MNFLYWLLSNINVLTLVRYTYLIKCLTYRIDRCCSGKENGRIQKSGSFLTKICVFWFTQELGFTRFVTLTSHENEVLLNLRLQTTTTFKISAFFYFQVLRILIENVEFFMTKIFFSIYAGSKYNSKKG